MKKLLTLIAITALVFSNATFGYAANPEIVTISIAISHTLDLEIGGSLNFPTTDPISPGVAKVAATALTVKNIGTGIDETFTLAETVPTGWTANYQFADAKPAIADGNWKTASNISEVIAYDVTKKLWLKLTPPATTPETSISISLTITAS
jgi:hypothetical protein